MYPCGIESKEVEAEGDQMISPKGAFETLVIYSGA
jgi:hypothetical protein